VTTETDTLLRIQQGRLPGHGLDGTHTSIGLFNAASANKLVSELSADLLDLIALGRDDLSQTLGETRMILAVGSIIALGLRYSDLVGGVLADTSVVVELVV
jgi:hypothetical protein